jgi:Acyl-CoA dehydrogenase, C-terminal domain
MIDAEQRSDLRRTFAAALDHEDPTKARAELLHSGWIDALAADEPVAVALLFRLQGQAHQDAAALDDVVVHHLMLHWPAAGEGDLAVAYPIQSTGRRTTTTHVAFPANGHAGRLLWISDLAPDPLQIVEVGAAARGHPVMGIDPSYGLIGFSSRPDGRVTEISGAAARAAWSEALAAAQIAVAHQMVAGANALLSLATEYAKARKQFGTPIGSFQAVKHRLAETLVAVSAADSAITAAATAPSATNGALAKVLAGRAAAAAGKHCLQVFGGIGFTAEHEFHRYYRRSLVLDRLLGDTQSLERRIGEVLRTRAARHERVVELSEAPIVDPLDFRRQQ